MLEIAYLENKNPFSANLQDVYYEDFLIWSAFVIWKRREEQEQVESAKRKSDNLKKFLPIYQR